VKSRLAYLLALLMSCSEVPATPATPPGAAGDSVGQVQLAVELSDGSSIGAVAFTIWRVGLPPIEGTIPRADASRTLSVAVTLPAGSDYVADMSAVSPDGKTYCGGRSQAFSVTPGELTMVAVRLQCYRSHQSGGVNIEATINHCPQITSVVAAPFAAGLGAPIELSASAVDPDSTQLLRFQWRGGPGRVSSLTGATTTFFCTEVGSLTLVVTVSDGQCSDSTTFPVTCLPGPCGNGRIDPGEECDPALNRGCNERCLFVQTVGACQSCVNRNAVEGNCQLNLGCTFLSGHDRELCLALVRCMRETECANVDPRDCFCGSAKGVACESSPNGACMSEMQAAAKSSVPLDINANFFSLERPLGHATAELACEHDFCGPSCGLPVCGDGVLEGEEQCDPPAPGACLSDCRGRMPAECLRCEAESRAAASETDACFGAIGCDGWQGEDRRLCEALLICMRDSRCWTKDGPLGCLCGTTRCATSSVDGACKAEIQAATKSPEPFLSGYRLYDPLFPASGATRLALCDFESCPSFCR
jgi:hypothetical protein